MKKENKKQIKLGLLGCGTVGSALVKLIDTQAEVIKCRFGIQLEIVKIGVQSLDKKRDEAIPKKLLTTDLQSIVNDENIDIVVELMGGTDLAKELLMVALKNSKLVVTANKELLADSGSELFQLAESKGVGVGFEASVAGAVPIVRTIIECMRGASINRISGILNGTTNYILSEMSEKGITYEKALLAAQKLGYAESNPHKDVSGQDAAAKIAILGSLAFSEKIDWSSIYCEGIEDIDVRDFSYVKQLGYALKFLALAERVGEKGIDIRVHPALVPSNHQLAKVNGIYNAVLVEGKAFGDLMFCGKGAGGDATASAVLEDILKLAIHPTQFVAPKETQHANILPMVDLESAYYLRIEVEDSPGVLAAVTKVFENNDVSIEVMNQLAEKDLAVLILITHITKEKNLNATIEGLKNLAEVKDVGSNIRVVDI